MSAKCNCKLRHTCIISNIGTCLSRLGVYWVHSRLTRDRVSRQSERETGYVTTPPSFTRSFSPFHPPLSLLPSSLSLLPSLLHPSSVHPSRPVPSRPSPVRPEFSLIVEPPTGNPQYLIAEIQLPGVVRDRQTDTHARTHRPVKK